MKIIDVPSLGVRGLTPGQFAKLRRAVNRENNRYSAVMQQIDSPPYQFSGATVLRAWRSRFYVAVLYRQDNGFTRLTVNRTELDDRGDYRADLTWDELMDVKEEVGLGDVWAVEVFPPLEHLVNVANMRHLWLLDGPPPYAWTE